MNICRGAVALLFANRVPTQSSNTEYQKSTSSSGASASLARAPLLLVLCLYSVGIMLVLCWYSVGIPLVLCWYSFGMVLLFNWIPVGLP